MTRPRKVLISLADTPYYHVTSPCVRRAFLCGVDHYSGQSYEHRRQWVVDRIRRCHSGHTQTSLQFSRGDSISGIEKMIERVGVLNNTE